MTDLTGLIARLEAAEGGSRELDAEIMCAIGGARRIDDFTFYGPNEAVWCLWDGTFDPPSIPELPYCTHSLDAALALVERALPGWIVFGLGQSSACWSCRLVEVKTDASRLASAKTPALALCLAVLHALQSKEQHP